MRNEVAECTCDLPDPLIAMCTGWRIGKESWACFARFVLHSAPLSIALNESSHGTPT